MKYKLHRDQKFQDDKRDSIKISTIFSIGDSIQAYNPQNKPLNMSLRNGSNGNVSVPVHPMFRVRIPLGISLKEAKGWVAKISIDPSLAFSTGLMQLSGTSYTEIEDDSGELFIDIINMSNVTVNLFNDVPIATITTEKISVHKEFIEQD